MIIQCPSCTTKFSVDSSKIRGMSNPRFHCSRCDHFFDLWGRAKRRTATKTSGSLTLPLETDADGEQLSLIPETSLSASLEGMSPVSIGPISAMAGDEDNLPLITADWPDFGQAEPFEADMREVIRKNGGDVPQAFPHLRQQATLEEPPAEDFSSATLGVRQAGSFVPVIESHTEILTQEDRPAPPVEKQLAEIDAVLSADKLEKSVVPFPKRKNGKQTEHVPRRSLLDSVKGDWISGISGFAALSCVPLVLCVLFYAWSRNFGETPSGLASLARLGSADFPRVPPAGLQVVGLKSNVLTLADGNKVIEVRGNIVNATTKAYEDVRVEGSIFAADNAPVQRLVVSPTNGLQNVSSLHSMKPEVISDFQNKSGITHRIRPNEQFPFRIIFVGGTDSAKWFAARVYSVKPAVS